MAIYTIGNRQFSSQKAIKAYIRQIIDRYQDYQSLDRGDFDFMLELLFRHPKSAVKIGCGVERIYVKLNPVYRNSRCFYLQRTDGSHTDFSFNECVRATPHRAKFVRACRSAIAQDIIEFKRMSFSNSDVLICPRSGLPFGWYDAHVHHCSPYTFAQIVGDFVATNEIDIGKVALLTAGDNRIIDEFADLQMRELFREYHNSAARLEIMSKEGHIQITTDPGAVRLADLETTQQAPPPPDF